MSKLIVAGVDRNGKSTVVRTEEVSEESSFATLWKSDRLPPSIERPATEGLYDMGISRGEAVWMQVRHEAGKSTHLHRTDALSFSTLISGSIELLLDTGSVAVAPGDSIILPGVMHGWRVGDADAVMSAFAIGLGPA
jgi:quercetin dioxygenase-like cupin family protein